MMWPWRRPRQTPVIEVTPAVDAVEALREAKARQPQVDRIVQAHRIIRRENHLGPRVRRALVGDDS